MAWSMLTTCAMQGMCSLLRIACAMPQCEAFRLSSMRHAGCLGMPATPATTHLTYKLNTCYRFGVCRSAKKQPGLSTSAPAPAAAAPARA